MPEYCPECAIALPPADLFCANCGADLRPSRRENFTVAPSLESDQPADPAGPPTRAV